MKKALRKRHSVLIILIALYLTTSFPASAIPSFYSGNIDTPEMWRRLLDTDTSIFWSQGDFQHNPWETESQQELADAGMNINFRIFWWRHFNNGEIAWNTSIIDFYYNMTLQTLIKEYIDSEFSHLDPDKLWAITLSEEEPSNSLKYFDNDAKSKYNSTYHYETGNWLRTKPPNDDEKLVYNTWNEF